jgi:transcriptional regulator with PAS, ATPase and Fis domain
VVAAPNQHLEQMCEAGTFRWDLLYRINTVALPLPPLRERQEEIEALASHFLRLANRTNQRQVDGIAPQVLLALKRHRWPGNVRELRNVIERAAVITRGNTVTLDDLPETIRSLAQLGGPSGLEAAVDESEAPDFKEQVRRFEAELIAQTLRACDNNQSETSRRLRIPLRTLVNKIQTYGLGGK